MDYIRRFRRPLGKQEVPVGQTPQQFENGIEVGRKKLFRNMFGYETRRKLEKHVGVEHQEELLTVNRKNENIAINLEMDPEGDIRPFVGTENASVESVIKSGISFLPEQITTIPKEVICRGESPFLRSVFSRLSKTGCVTTRAKWRSARASIINNKNYRARREKAADGTVTTGANEELRIPSDHIPGNLTSMIEPEQIKPSQSFAPISNDDYGFQVEGKNQKIQQLTIETYVGGKNIVDCTIDSDEAKERISLDSIPTESTNMNQLTESLCQLSPFGILGTAHNSICESESNVARSKSDMGWKGIRAGRVSKEFLLPQDTNLTTHTLVIDLDETLVHSSFEPIPNSDVISIELDGATRVVYVAKRPHVDAFLHKMAPLFECVLFTASEACYANPGEKFHIDLYRVYSAC